MLICLSGLDPKSTKYEELKTFLKAFGPVAFVAYEAGDSTVSWHSLNAQLIINA